MKKCWATLSILLLSISLIGCSVQKKPQMELKSANLTEKETQLLKLAGYHSVGGIFDYTIDETIKSFTIICYELDKTGNWKQTSGGGSMPLEDATGRISTFFDDTFGNGMGIARQQGSEVSMAKNNLPAKINISDMSQNTVYATAETIEPEKEIPLAIQIITGKQEVSLYDVSYFHQPKKYQEKGYEHVYAVTIKFSKTILQ